MFFGCFFVHVGLQVYQMESTPSGNMTSPQSRIFVIRSPTNFNKTVRSQMGKKLGINCNVQVGQELGINFGETGCRCNVSDWSKITNKLQWKFNVAAASQIGQKLRLNFEKNATFRILDKISWNASQTPTQAFLGSLWYIGYNKGQICSWRMILSEKISCMTYSIAFYRGKRAFLRCFWPFCLIKVTFVIWKRYDLWPMIFWK